jgi:VanZ family protein
MKLKSYWLFIGWSLIILILSWIPGNYIPRTISFRDWLGPDKLAHLIMYGVLSFIYLRAFAKYYDIRKFRVRYILGALIVGMIFGFITEWIQRHPFIGRNGNIFDFGADILGSVIGILAFHIFYRRKIEAVKNN